MKNVTHSKAPVSEVIFGYTYNIKKFTDETIFKFYELIANEFNNFQYLNPLADEIVNPENGLFQVESLPSKTGAILFRFRNKEGNQLIQIQGNKIYYNWIRPDSINPNGVYPGFKTNYDLFLKKVNQLKEITGLNLDEEIKYIELTYHDRIFWEEYISNLNEIDKILVIKALNIPKNKKTLNLSIKQAELIQDHYLAKVSINSAYSVNSKKKILGLEYSITGAPYKTNPETWFKTAHEMQIDFFNKIINPEILKQWE